MFTIQIHKMHFSVGLGQYPRYLKKDKWVVKRGFAIGEAIP